MARISDIRRITLNWRGLLTDALGLAFAAFWAARGAHAAAIQPAMTAILIAIPTLALLAGFCQRDIIRCQPDYPVNKVLLKRTKIMRVVLIFAASYWTHATHHMAMFLPLLGAVIGLSYILTAQALAEPVHMPVGVGIVLISGLSFLLPEPQHIEIAGFGTAACVWLGSMVRLWRSARQSVAPLAPGAVQA